MKFHKKHPYLFWELIGLAVLFIDFLLIVCFFGLLDLKGDAVYATIVFTAIFAPSGAMRRAAPADAGRSAVPADQNKNHFSSSQRHGRGQVFPALRPRRSSYHFELIWILRYR